MVNDNIKKQIITRYKANPNQGFVDFLISLDELSQYQPEEVAETLMELVVVVK